MLWPHLHMILAVVEMLILYFIVHKLFLDHDIIFYFQITLKNLEKNLRKVLNTIENIMENGAYYVVFQRHQKALLWSKGLNTNSFTQC